MNLIKMNEIGPVLGKSDELGYHRLRNHERVTGEKLTTFLVKSTVQPGTPGRPTCKAYKISDIAKILGMKAKDLKLQVESLRVSQSQPAQLEIVKGSK